MLKRTAHALEEKWRSSDVIIKEKAEFSSFLLSEKVLIGLEKAGFKYPSPIQLEAIPIGRICKDLIVQAKSGTGKTLVFTIIALEMLLEIKCPQVLILAPTREVAVQICHVIKAVGCEFNNLSCYSFIGGFPVSRDNQVAEHCQIAVGTPGRIKQLISLNILKTSSIRLFVLDEADELLQPSFKSHINDIFKMLPKEKQVIATSATYPNELKKLAQMYFKEPYHARLNIKELSLLGMVHYFFVVPISKLPVVAYNLKLEALKDILMTIKFSQCMVFCNMISRVDSLCFNIKSWGFSTTYISSAKEQSDRLKAIECLKRFKCKVLVSSDVTSRGIDAENVDFVVNFDLPNEFEVYLHRVGRAGRYGSKCASVTFIDQGEIDSYKKMQAQGHFKSFLLPDPVPSNLICIMPTEQSVEDNGFDKSESCNSNPEQNGEQNLEDCNQNKTDVYNQLLDENKSIPEKYLDSSNSVLVDSKKSCSSSENIDENSVEIDICLSPAESGYSQAEIENSCSSSENILCLSESVDSQVKNEKLSAALSTLEEQNLELNLFEDKIKSVNNENKPGLECNDTVMESTCETNNKIVEETGDKIFLNEMISLIPDITGQELKSSEPITEMQLKTGLKPSLTTSESVVNDELSELASEGGLKSKKNKKNSKAKADNFNVSNINLEENLSSVTNFINNHEKDGNNVQSPKGNFNLGDFMSTSAPPLNTYIPNLRLNLNQYYYNTYKEFMQDISNSLVNQLNDSRSLNDDKKIQEEIKGANVHSASYGTSEDISDSKYLTESCETQLKSVYSDVKSDLRSILTAFDNSKQQTPENNCEQAIEHEKSKSDSNYANINSISNNKVENKSRFSMSKIPVSKGSAKLANNSSSENSSFLLKLNVSENRNEKSVANNINFISGNEVESKQKPMNKISTEEIKSGATLDTDSSSERESSSENEVEDKQKPINKISTETIKSSAALDTESSSESESSGNEVEGKQKPINKISTEKIKSVATLDTESSSESESSGNEVEGKQKPINKISAEKIKSVATLDTESSSESESSENEIEGKQKPINKFSTEKIKSGAALDTESSSESEGSSENEVEDKQKPINKIAIEKIKSVATLDTESSSESESSENKVEGKQKSINKISTEKIKSVATLDTESSSESESSENAGKQLFIHNKTKSKPTTFNETDSDSSPKLMSTGSNSIIFNKGEMSHDSDSSADEMQFKLLVHAFQDLMKKRGKRAKARNKKIKSYLHEIEGLKLSSREPSIAKTSMSLRSSSRCGSQKKNEPKGEFATNSSESFHAKSQINYQPEFPRKVTKPIQKSQTRPSSRLQNQYEAHPQLSQPHHLYGQPLPLYNQSVPQPSLLYAQPSPRFIQPGPQFIQPNPQQTRPSPRFIWPSSQHTQLCPQYVQPGSLYSQFGYGPQFMPPSVQNPHISSQSHHSSRCCSRQS